MKKLFVAFGLAAMPALGAGAQAAPVTWSLQDVVFEDGGVATGSFVFDADTGVFSEINVTTTMGSVLDGESYDIPLPVSGGNEQFLIFANSAGVADFTGFNVIAIQLSDQMTNLGGMIALSIAGFTFEYTCVDSDCLGPADPLRRLSSGYITSEVPAPAALPLFAIGLAGLGAHLRKRRMANA